MMELITSTVLIPSILITSIIVLLVYYTVVRNWNYFKSQNVKFIRGWPIFGSISEFLTKNISISDFVLKLYWTYPNERLFGMYEFLRPVYFLRDPELVKQIGIKDFDHFVNHANNIDISNDPLLGKGLVFIKDQQWRDMRTVLSPAFTGSKMRAMFSLMTDYTDEFIRHLQLHDRKVYEMKDLFTRYASDIIATCAFGLKVDSLKESDNEFFRAGMEYTKIDGLKLLKFLLYDSYPKLLKYLGVKINDVKIEEYFRKIINDTISHREINKILRPDMVHLLMEARKEAKKIREWDDDDLIAQCLLFFQAGFETSSTLLSFMAHELTINPDIQQRLYEEVLQTEENLHGSQITYDALNKMKYMDAVVSETLRRWPPITVMDRLVSKSYKFENDGHTIELHRGDVVMYPILGFHMDEKYFPDPKVFNPDRFMDEHRDKITPGTYLPFGMGPRICIGNRFALMECKQIFYQMLLKFSFEKCDRTPDPLILKKKAFNLTAENGFWIELRSRK